MAKISVDEIQSRVAAITDQDERTSQIPARDYALRLSFINKLMQKWAEVNDWQVLYTEYNMLVSTSTGNASIALPSDFRKPASAPRITYDGTNTFEFPITRPQDARQYDDFYKRVEFLGNYQDNYTLRVYGVTLSSGASLKLPYYMSVQSLVSPANITEIPNPDYLVEGTIGMWWEAREDPRFQDKKAEAERILRNMIEFENVFPDGSQYSRVKTIDETEFTHRWGE